jgi:hypothetical protein
MRTFSTLVAIAYLLTSPLLIQPSVGLEEGYDDIFKDISPEDLSRVPDEDTIVHSPLNSLASWDTWDDDAPWAKRSEFDLTQLNPTDSETYLWGGPRSTFSSLYSLILASNTNLISE